MSDATEDELDDLPTFEDAATGMQALLESRGHPTAIIWIRAGDLTQGEAGPVVALDPLDEGEERGQAAFEEALARGLGVVLQAVCTWADRTCVVIYGPRDAEEAERLLMGNLVKLGVPARLPVATRRWPVC